MSDYVKALRQQVGTMPLILVGSTVIVFNEEKQILLQLRSDIRMWGVTWWSDGTWRKLRGYS